MNTTNYNEMLFKMQHEKDSIKKYEEMKNRIDKFAEVSTLKDAKSLLMQILPVNNDVTRFSVGSAKCIVINKNALLRISLISEEEVIIYNFE